MMKYIFYILPLFAILLSCSNDKKGEIEIHEVDWKAREARMGSTDQYEKGKTYLSLYSSIYSYSEKSTTNLTATTSIRNTDEQDTIYLKSAKYYNTSGELIRTYFDFPVYIAPLETVEIVIHQSDEAGGTGGNFIFEWAKDSATNEPFFEAIMISMRSQQGLSFSTQGKRIDRKD